VVPNDGGNPLLRWSDLDKFPARLRPYVALIRAYLSERLTGVELGLAYLALFKREVEFFPDAIYQPLEDLFGALDGFEPDDGLRSGVIGGLDDDQLRVAARTALNRLVAACQEGS
jgi:hypothetical protein